MITFKVKGIPIPQGSKRAFNIGGKINLVEANPNHKAWRQQVSDAAKQANDTGFLYTCPIMVEYMFIMPKPQKPKFNQPAVKPDLDKLIRSINDALTGTLIKDDGLITIIHAEKRYQTNFNPPGVQITITEA